ncbi:MAG: hypothetical protein ACK4NC_04360 [Candidatus Gracilibacteria bacterium]
MSLDIFIKSLQKLSIVCGVVVLIYGICFIGYLFIPSKWMLLHQVTTWEQIPFDRDLWLKSAKEERGTMIKSLVENQKFDNMKRDNIEETLGKSNLYCGNDVMACYEVSHKNISYELGFFPKDSGQVDIFLNKID